MKKKQTPLARAAALLLAAAALPLTPLIAQETTQPPADPPVVQTTPPAAEAPAPVQPTPAPEPVATTPTATAPEPAAETPAAPVRRTTTTRTTRTTTRAPARVAAPAPAPVAVAPAPAPVETLPTTEAAPLPPPVAQTPPPEVLPETATVPPAAPAQDNRASFLPWLLAGLLLVGAIAFFALRRRRRTDVYDEVYEPAPAAAPVVAEPVAAAAPIAAAAPAGRPELELAMRPVRAGVTGDDARVEFELIVDNRGRVAAEEVRISTWMLAAGSSEAESALIVPRGHADTPPVTIAAGQSRTLEASVALPTAEVEGDAVLPVVVADARYRLPDGSEGRTSASFAVGVPDGEGAGAFRNRQPVGPARGRGRQTARRARTGLNRPRRHSGKGRDDGRVWMVAPRSPKRRNSAHPSSSEISALTTWGRCSMKCFPSARLRPVISRTSLMTSILRS
jgi:hypothetical protein